MNYAAYEVPSQYATVPTSNLWVGAKILFTIGMSKGVKSVKRVQVHISQFCNQYSGGIKRIRIQIASAALNWVIDFSKVVIRRGP